MTHIASCGCKLKDDEKTVYVISFEEDCDAMDGFHPCTSHSSYCPKCAAEWKERGLLFESEELADSWLDAASEANRRWKEAAPGKENDKAMKAYHAIYALGGAKWTGK